MSDIDKNYNVSRQGQRVLDIVADDFVDSVTLGEMEEVRTFPFYNGRERLVGIELSSFANKKAFVVTFGECRNSDSIVIDSWFLDKTYNPPTHHDFPEEAYKLRRKRIDVGEYVKAAKEVNKLLSDGITRLRQEWTTEKVTPFVHPPQNSFHTGGRRR